MPNPFLDRASSPRGPARDLLPVAPDDNTDLGEVAVGLYVETGGMVSVVTVAGNTRSVSLPDFSMLPVGVQRILATGTTASGIHALVLG